MEFQIRFKHVFFLDSDSLEEFRFVEQPPFGDFNQWTVSVSVCQTCIQCADGKREVFDKSVESLGKQMLSFQANV